jgi:hypothetical protein
MFNKLWRKTKEVASMYTGTFIVVMLLNQLIFFGFCLNPVCLIAAMPHVLFITVIIGTWLNREEAKRKKDIVTKDEANKFTEQPEGSCLDDSNIQSNLSSLSDESNETHLLINNKYKENVQLKTKHKINNEKQDASNLSPSKSAAICITLTADKYLNNDQFKVRESLSLASNSGSFLLEHDINNKYDPLAIKVTLNGTYIGHIYKGNNEREIDRFCFEHGQLRDGISIVRRGQGNHMSALFLNSMI